MLKKARDGVEGLLPTGEVLVEGEESREVSVERRAAFCDCVVRRARLSFFVCWSLRRRSRIDSGVGAVQGTGSVRFYQMSVGGCFRRETAFSQISTSASRWRRWRI